VKIGDYVMVHAGLAIQKYDEQEALDNLALIRELFEKTASP
jgi:hydrogenase maturation factor